MDVIDFTTVRREIRSAARRAFDVCLAKHPGESFYAFALFSDDSAMTVCPATMTEQAYDRCVERQREKASRTPSLLSLDEEFADYCASYLRWGMAEGVYEYGHECFQTVSELINVEPRYDDDDPDGFVNFKGRVFASMVLGLKDLDAEGYFGTGKLRERITLLCSVSDSDCAAWLEADSVRRLNSPAVFERFWKQWTRDDSNAQAGGGDRREPRVYQAFLHHLNTDGKGAEPNAAADGRGL